MGRAIGNTEQHPFGEMKQDWRERGGKGKGAGRRALKGQKQREGEQPHSW